MGANEAMYVSLIHKKILKHTHGLSGKWAKNATKASKALLKVVKAITPIITWIEGVIYPRISPPPLPPQ